MRDYISIGSAPSEEECVQVGSEDYSTRARKECQRYIATIRRVCGDEPDGARLVIKDFPHDFGTYYEVVCYYDNFYPKSFGYASWVEENGPLTWDEGVNQRRFVYKED